MAAKNRSDEIAAALIPEQQRRREVLLQRLADRVGDRFIARLVDAVGVTAMREIATRVASGEDLSGSVEVGQFALDTMMTDAFADCGIKGAPESLEAPLWGRAWEHAVAVIARYYEA